MKSKFLIGAVAVVALGVFAVALLQQPSTSVSTNTTEPPSAQTQTQVSNTASSAGSAYTMADVAQHNSASSCWTAINGNVYDVTTWINQHPGGPQRILGLCGIDGSSAFNNQHGGQARPESELATFRIGTLK